MKSVISIVLLILLFFSGCRFEGTDSGNPEEKKASLDCLDQDCRVNPVDSFLNGYFCPLADSCGHPHRSQTCGTELLSESQLGSFWVDSSYFKSNGGLADDFQTKKLKLDFNRWKACVALFQPDTQPCRRLDMGTKSISETLTVFLSMNSQCRALARD